MKGLGHGRRWAAVVAALAACVALAACGSDGGSGSGGAAGASTSGSGSKTIGVLILVQADEQSQRVLKAIEKEAAGKDLKVSVIDAKYDPTKAQAGMDTFINQKVDGIITFATDNEQLAAKIKTASDAKIPVISITGGKVVDGLTWSLDFAEEKSAGELADKFFTAVKNSGRDQTAVEMVLPEAVPCRRREAGFDAAAKKYPGVKVTKYHIDGNNAVAAANTYFQQYLQAHRNLGGVIACWDIPLTGALTAAQSANIDKGFVAMGINGSSDSVEKLQAKEPYLQADLGVALAKAGQDTVIQMAKVLAGEKTDIPASKYSTVTYGILTPDDAPPEGELEKPEWLPQGWAADYWK
jgi:ABC-type sugar transport system substrate-binding protein